MTAAIRIDDPADPRVAEYTALTDARLRTSLEAEHGLFMAEGAKVIRRAVAAGYGMRSVLCTPERLTSVEDLDLPPGTPLYVMAEAVARTLTGFRVHRGALAAMTRRALPAAGGLIAAHDRLLVLEDLADHTNVGAIFRCAAALGVGAVLLAPRCADPLYRRSVKVSMGAVFVIPYARMTDWYGGLADLRATGFRVLALTPDQSVRSIEEVPRAGRVALLLGAEGDGLSSRWLNQADERVCIPMSPTALALGVDSLNVVAAAAIACRALARLGSAGPGPP